MKDSYSLDIDEEGLDKQYKAHYQAYFNIFHRCGISVIAVGSDVGMMGGSLAHEYMYLTPVGEDTLVLCSLCGYAANRQIARFSKPVFSMEKLNAIELVETPNIKTIDDLSAYLKIPKYKIAKAVLMIAGYEENGRTREEFIFAVIRGDMDVNETKLGNIVKADWLRPASEDEILLKGAVPGYTSPIGLKDIMVVVDDAVISSPNLVAGANREGFHLLNLNTPRDYDASIVADIAVAGDGDACIQCGNPLHTSRGVEVGNIFKLGTRYSSAVNASYLTPDGSQKPIVMGSYGIGSGRLLACVAEENHDDVGLRWPITIAPYQLHLVALNGKSSEVRLYADNLYQTLISAGLEVLYDDRDETPGVKFMDADLIGLPIRITVSDKSLAKGGVELKRRDLSNTEIIFEL